MPHDTPDTRGRLVFGTAALLLAALGAWLVVRERDAFESSVRVELAARARTFAAEVVGRAGTLVAQASGEEASAVRGKDGNFSTPPEPRAFQELRLAPFADHEGTFYLDRAARAEREPADADAAREFYRMAAGEGRQPACRLIALHRHAALERRLGRAAEARRLTDAFVAALSPEFDQTREALLARVLARRGRLASDAGEPADPELPRDLVLHLGGGDDATVVGLLQELGAEGLAALAARRLELALMQRLRALAPPQDESRGALVRGERLVAWVRDVGAGLRFAEGELPVAPEGTKILRADRLPVDAAGLVEVAPLGPLLPGLLCTARLSGVELERRRLRHLGLFALVLVPLLVVSLLALATTWRAVRREREAAEVRAAFVQRVGHDLRTPLAVMRLYAETLAEGRARTPEEGREFAATIVREAEALSEMAQAALDFERLDAGGAQPTRLDLVTLAREVALIQRALAREAGLALELELPEDPVFVRADGAGLRGALGNLITNARVHGGQGGGSGEGGEVRIVLQADAARVRLHVLDRGPGLPPGPREPLFERFVRGANATARGSGLGLALAREVAEAAGGTLRARDREGGGCEMILELPLDGEVRE
ncbi:MAG: HAMP domain-containing sensor histidine kinase [Planctomycetota bacterium]